MLKCSQLSTFSPSFCWSPSTKQTAEGPTSLSQQERSSDLYPVHEKCYTIINALENHVFHFTTWVGKIWWFFTSLFQFPRWRKGTTSLHAVKTILIRSVKHEDTKVMSPHKKPARNSVIMVEGTEHSKWVMHSFWSKILVARYDFLGWCQARGFKSVKNNLALCFSFCREVHWLQW